MATVDLPDTMTAVRLYEFGGPEVLQVEKHPVPRPADDEVLIKVKATSVSGWDVAFRTGIIKPIPGRASIPLPQQLGREAAGEVVAKGSMVRNFQEGDRVVMMVNPACGQCSFCLRGSDNLCINTSLPAHTVFGGYAEYIVRPATAVLKAPDNIPFEKLACCIWSYGTIFHMINSRAALRPGESVLITGASGGMGTAAIQLARFAGASPIIALSSDAKKKDVLLANGADYVLNWKDRDIEAQIRALTPDGMGVDVVLDNVGGPMASLAIDAARMAGRVVLAAVLGGHTIELSIMKAFIKHLTIMGSRASTRRDQQTILQLVAQGKLDPVIGKTFKLEEAVEATKFLEGGAHTGKVVLVL